MPSRHAEPHRQSRVSFKGDVKSSAGSELGHTKVSLSSAPGAKEPWVRRASGDPRNASEAVAFAKRLARELREPDGGSVVSSVCSSASAATSASFVYSGVRRQRSLSLPMLAGIAETSAWQPPTEKVLGSRTFSESGSASVVTHTTIREFFREQHRKTRRSSADGRNDAGGARRSRHHREALARDARSAIMGDGRGRT
eukprot:TRINITY_DN28357_c0_g1_i1.p1 TRINITY_DN28357_c0_g1~~TRINITY_DN28357_c0_g1_i1.p1  ORF type:complete len:198 (-),score=27.92 TRINITY_DN28357_c0_g1_i1:40-633(-)